MLTHYGSQIELANSENRLTLLGHFIYLHKLSQQNSETSTAHKDFVHVISMLLSSVADEINLDGLQYGRESHEKEEEAQSAKISEFVQEQILSLVNQESIGNLLAAQDSRSGSAKLNEEAKQLASYALTLLRFFPRRGDEIRMWIYLGSAASGGGDRLPAIKYFWEAARSSTVFDTISRDSRAAVRLLKPTEQSNSFWQAPKLSKVDQEKADSIQDDWRVILVFLELYTFVLKLMDDEEFFSASALHGNTRSEAASTWAGHNALPLRDVEGLTTFLKNLGFTMYFNAAEITDIGERDSNTSGSISSYFRVSSTNDIPQASGEEKKPREFAVAGLSGMSLDYVKGLVTGLLRMIYERDSRRKFLPQGHWLMTSRFDMEGFIPAVVAEEENRHRVQEEDDADVDDVDDGDDSDYEGLTRGHLVGTQRELRARHLERLRRQQRKASRKRYLQAVAPRLEILQNLPFFIPFETRVQIFRDFVRLDQVSPNYTSSCSDREFSEALACEYIKLSLASFRFPTRSRIFCLRIRERC